ncbi:MAG: preprotein translocase subunit SecG [Sedimentisphaerales bacterium]|nr:preprotein translocase subunit SecG [Sedimentisphaerales bacterium]
MTVFPMLAVSFIMNVVAVLFVICCVALILIILIQKGRGGGLSGAFGAAMASGILGSKTGDFLTWVTITLVGVFLLLAVVMAKFYKPDVASDYDVIPQTQQQPLESPEQPVPSDAAEETAGQTDAGADINLPGS